MRNRWWRVYWPVNPDHGYPFGALVFYECSQCGTILRSRPRVNAGCRCGNLFIDLDYGRLSVTDESQLRIFYSLWLLERRLGARDGAA